jgi:hypothetical protein
MLVWGASEGDGGGFRSRARVNIRDWDIHHREDMDTNIIPVTIRALRMEGEGCISLSRIRGGWGWVEEDMAWGCMVGSRVVDKGEGVRRDRERRVRCR